SGLLMLVKTLHRTVLNRRLTPPGRPPGPIAIGPPNRTEKLPRRFGEFLLTSRLDEDALGAVYRGLALGGEEQEFVQVRLFNSPELAWTSLAETLVSSSWFV